MDFRICLLAKIATLTFSTSLDFEVLERPVLLYFINFSSKILLPATNSFVCICIVHILPQLKPTSALFVRFFKAITNFISLCLGLSTCCQCMTDKA